MRNNTQRLHLQSLLARLYEKDQKEFFSVFFDSFHPGKGKVVSFVYFAQLMLSGFIFCQKNQYSSWYEEQEWILPDGIAIQILSLKFLGNLSLLQIFKNYKRAKDYGFPNLNGTDFIPEFLDQLSRSSQEFSLILYGSTQEGNENAIKHLQKLYPHASIVGHHGYEDRSYFDWKGKISAKVPTVFLIGTGSPRQELWLGKYQKQIGEDGVLAFAVGGLIDRFGGLQERGPDWIVRSKLEWLYRLVSNPRKNFRKVFVSLFIFWILLFW